MVPLVEPQQRRYLRMFYLNNHQSTNNRCTLGIEDPNLDKLKHMYKNKSKVKERNCREQRWRLKYAKIEILRKATHYRAIHNMSTDTRAMLQCYTTISKANWSNEDLFKVNKLKIYILCSYSNLLGTLHHSNDILAKSNAIKPILSLLWLNTQCLT